MSLVKRLASIAPLRNLTRHFYCKYTLYTALYGTLTLQNSDVDDQTTATISIYAQNKSSNLFQSRHQKQEICLGKESIHIALHPKSKTTERFVLNSNPNAGQSNDIQLLVVHGTFVSRRTQNMLNNTILFEDFITAYVHTGMVPVSSLCHPLSLSPFFFMLYVVFCSDGIDFGAFCVVFNLSCMILNTKR